MDNIENLETQNKLLLKKWLFLGVFALALSGLFAIFLVIGRSPHINKLLPHVDFFKLSLTIHVNLSVFAWLSCAVIFTSRITPSKINNQINNIGFWLALIGTIIIPLSIFDSSASAYLNNYIPMASSQLLKTGLGMFTLGVFISSTALIFNRRTSLTYLAAPIIITQSCIAVLISYFNLESNNIKELYNNGDYYELLFWSGGHLLQFAFVQIMIIAWFKILFKDLENNKKASHILLACSLINVLAATYGLIGLGRDNLAITEFEYINFFTNHMKHFGGIASIIAASYIIPKIIKTYKKYNENKWLRNSVIWSIILFMSGGFISLFISGVNTIIPAHYHGSIVGVSLGVMGYVYLTLPELGYKIVNVKMARIQPIFYGAGQLIHITGLAISGGYGALRKTPGMMESFEGKFYMGIMGLGGLISIIGGLLFVIVIVNSILKNNKTRK